MTATLQPAFVLHRRPYRETSLIVELFTQDHGRIAIVARGIRKARSRTAVLLQPFMPLLVSWYGKGELMTLNQVEANGFHWLLSGKNLRCGFYLNELLMRLLPKQDPHARLFAIYQQTLTELQRAAFASEATAMCEKTLRLFEKRLLMEIGYGLPLQKEQQALCFNDAANYRFQEEQGFLPCSVLEQQADNRRPGIFSGKILNALLAENFMDNNMLQEVKRLTRFMLASLLRRPLESRRLFLYPLEMEENG